MKKTLSLFLTLILTLSICSISVFAEDETNLSESAEISFNLLTNIRLYDVMEISIRSGSTGEGITISSDYIINEILNVTDRLKLKKYSTEIGGSRGGWAYSVMFGLDDNSSIEYTCSTGIEVDGKTYEAIDDSELKNTLEKYYNLMKSINSSAWATEEIAVATELGILNANNSYNYTANIMREEFCDLAVNMIESTGLVLSAENPQKTLGIRDTDNVNVLKLYKAGIILGKEHNKTGVVFAPTDLITREEAATILGRIATYLNISSKEDIPYANYSDGSSISDWAGVAVHTMYQLGVMKGVSETEFLPKGNYTVEQSIATLVRLYSKYSDEERTIDLDNTNAENLSYAQIEELQKQVDEGHYPWRLDYNQVITSFISGLGEDVENGELVSFSGDVTKCSGTYIVGNNSYLIELFKPIDKSEHGIWVVRSCEKTNKEVLFYERTPEQSLIEKSVDGWYTMPRNFITTFPFFENTKPKSVAAIYTHAGTEMEDTSKEIAKISAPYSNQTMAEVLSMEIDLPYESIRGHLQFEFEFEDGSIEKTEYYKIYQE